jgi:methylthioribulose-1-phosphate dehydratase
MNEREPPEVLAAIGGVINAGRHAALRGWVPATSGNFSVRIDAGHIAITRSGVDKGALERQDILLQALLEPLLPGSSAEAELHVRMYRDHPALGAISHVHSPHAAAIGRAFVDRGSLELFGWELGKAFAGVTSHEEPLLVPIFDNSQDIRSLADRIGARLAAPEPEAKLRAPGYLLAGHGLYAWGKTPSETAKHLEAFDALFQQQLLLGRYRP